MSLADVILLVLLVALVVASIWERIPEGYQDEDGFHYGRPPGDDR